MDPLLDFYPTTITDDILDAIATSDKVCKDIDLPLQHAADDVLRRMKRPGSRRQDERLLARIRARVPGVSLRTTFIVGFPGETDAEFDELCGFLRTVEFDHVGVSPTRTKTARAPSCFPTTCRRPPSDGGATA